MRRKVSFVIQLLDDFTDSPVENASAWVRTEDGRMPQRKPGGYYVFLDCPDRVTVTVTSPFYRRENLLVDQTREEGLVKKIRLKPDSRYVIPPDTTCMTGRAPAGSRVGLVLESPESRYRLLYDYSRKKEPDRIEIFHPQEQDLEKRWFLIADRDGSHRELFQVSRYREGICGLDQPLSSDYKKAGTRLYPFYHTWSDEKGIYFLPVRERIGEHTDCRIWLEEKEYPGVLEPGCRNIHDF